jgi:hypothetical protein
LGHFLGACRTDITAFENRDVIRITAENAGRLVLLEDYFIILNENLQRVAVVKLHGSPELYRQHDASQIIDPSYDTCVFHFFPHFPTASLDACRIVRLSKETLPNKPAFVNLYYAKILTE